MGEPLIFMISGFLDASPSPKTNYSYLSRRHDCTNNSRKIRNQFLQIICLSSLSMQNMCKSKMLDMLGKQGLEKHEDSYLNCLHTLAMGSTSSGKHEMELW